MALALPNEVEQEFLRVDSMTNTAWVFVGIGVTVFAFLIFLLGADFQGKLIENQCQSFGMANINGSVHECHKK